MRKAEKIQYASNRTYWTSVYEWHTEKSRLDSLKNCFFINWVQKIMDKWA